ncbi:oxidoreductase domain protein [Pavlovales sp. CCMP2436]|nr:oxidoreductase domain protein [Pavlovales sp. CCMP2436]
MLHPNAVIVAIADPNADSRDRAAQLLGSARKDVDVYESHLPVLARTDIDVLILATPNHTHIEVLRQAIPTGKHVLCEKPLCTSVEHCIEVLNLHEAQPPDRRGLLWVGMEYRYMAPLMRIAHELRSDTVGPLRMLSIREHRFPFLQKVGDWNRFNANTGGTLVEKACHFFDLICYLNNLPSRALSKPGRPMPIAVFATGGQALNHTTERYEQGTPDVLDHAYVLLEFENGARASLEMSMFAEASAFQFEVSAVGERGKLEAFMPGHGDKDEDKSLPNVRIGRRSEELTSGEWKSTRPPGPEQTKARVQHVAVHADARIVAAGDHHGSTYIELDCVVRAVAERAKMAHVSVADSILAVAIGMAAHRSIEELRRVPLAELVDVERLRQMLDAHDGR